MAVSVTAETILVSKWAALEIATSCVWLALGLVLVIGAIITLVKMAHAYTHYQDSKLDYDEIGCLRTGYWPYPYHLPGVGHCFRDYFPREAHLRLCNQYAGLKGGHSI